MTYNQWILYCFPVKVKRNTICAFPELPYSIHCSWVCFKYTSQDLWLILFAICLNDWLALNVDTISRRPVATSLVYGQCHTKRSPLYLWNLDFGITCLYCSSYLENMRSTWYYNLGLNVKVTLSCPSQIACPSITFVEWKSQGVFGGVLQTLNSSNAFYKPI